MPAPVHRSPAFSGSAAMLAFAAAIFFLIVTPGPGVLSVAGVGSGFGWQPGLRYTAGLMLGTNLVAAAVASGLWLALATVPWLKTVLLGLSLCFLAWIAWRIAFAGSTVAFARAMRVPGFLDGIALQFVNPKAYAVNTTLFGGFPLGLADPAEEIAVKFLIINLIWMPVHLSWLYAGIRVRQMALAPTTQRRINIAMAAAMMLVVALTLVA